jgi:LuxR family maltose regulon positive regulatory protein
MEPITLIRTKLHHPWVASDLVERPRLVGKLNQRLERKLTLVAAPAGYGKTTLVAEWLETCERPNIWLSLDESDSDQAVFLHYLINAVQTVFPEIGEKTLALLRAPEPPPLPILSSTVINDLDRIEQPFILALDDYHLVRDMAVHNLMDELLRYAPQTLHLVLISRLNPPLNLRPIRARGQMVEIRAEELRFTTDETMVFVQKVWGAYLDETVAARLQEKTEGWATGLRLCFLSLQGPEELNDLADRLPGRGLATDYLFHEVFASQPKSIQEQLLRTSILERFSVALCEYLGDAETESERLSGRAFINGLEQADVFVVALDDERQWFRYHHLFQALLRRQLAQKYDAEGIARLHGRASEWFAQNGLIEEAIHHALTAGDATLAVELIEQNKDAILNADRWSVLERWLSYLPEQIIQQRPGLLLAQMWIAHFHYDISVISPLLQQLGALLGKGAVDPATAGERAFFNGLPLFWHGETEQSIEYFERALASLPPGKKFARGATDIFLATAYQMIGEAERSVAKHRTLLGEEQSENARKGRLLGSLIFVYLLSGQSTEAYRFTNHLKRMAKRMDGPFFDGWADYLLGHIYWGWNEHETAIPHFMQVVENRFFLDRHTPIDSYIGLALSYQASGQMDLARETMEQLLVYAQTSRNPMSTLLARSAQARLAILQGDLEKALHLLRTIDFSMEHRTMLFWIETPGITHGRVLIARGTDATLQKGVIVLQEHLQFAQNAHNSRKQIEILPLLAVAYQRQGHHQQAIDALKQAVRLAEPGDWLYPFLETGSEMPELLDGLRLGSAVQDFINQIRAGFPASPLGSSSHGRAQLPEPLTDRELEVLALLARRYSNKEIARQLFISPTTVKRHASNIYQKLQVGGRRQAVEKAIALGVFSALE